MLRLSLDIRPFTVLVPSSVAEEDSARAATARPTEDRVVQHAACREKPANKAIPRTRPWNRIKRSCNTTEIINDPASEAVDAEQLKEYEKIAVKFTLLLTGKSKIVRFDELLADDDG